MTDAYRHLHGDTEEVRRLKSLTTALSARIETLINENKLKRRIIQDTLKDNERLTKQVEQATRKHRTI
jgi:hypothetical protein